MEFKINQECVQGVVNNNIYKPGDIENFDKLVDFGLIEDGGEIRGYHISNRGKISNPNYEYKTREMKWFKFFKNINDALAYKYLPELLYWRDVYNEGWKPSQNERKYIIYFDFDDNKIKKSYFDNYSAVLAFKTEELRDEFYEIFYDLIKECAPLLTR